MPKYLDFGFVGQPYLDLGFTLRPAEFRQVLKSNSF